jgi:hypothetical protein
MELKLVVPVKPAHPVKSTDDKTKGILERKNMIAFQMKNYENIKAWKC